MDWTLEQLQRINELQSFYLSKTNKLLEALENGKVTMENYYKDCATMVKSVKTDKQLREWTIVIDCMNNIINNVYDE